MTACGAANRRGGTCGQAAGWGTDHPGTGRCKLHGGRAGRPPLHGRYSLAHRASLAEKAQRFRTDPAPGDLSEELVLMRALLQDYLERFGEHLALRAEDIQFLAGMVEQVGRLVERISRIHNSTALTQAELQLLQARLADLLVTYVADPEQRRRFLDELRAAVGPARLGPGPAGGLDGA